MINWNLLQPVDIAGSFQQGLERGRVMARERAVESALQDLLPSVVGNSALGGGGFVEDQSPEYQARKRRAISALAMYAPDKFAALENMEQSRTKRLIEQGAIRTQQTLGAQAVTDPTGAANNALAMGDFDLAKKIRELAPEQGKVMEARLKSAAPFAYQGLKLPDDASRKAYIQQNRETLIAGGWQPEVLDNYQGDRATLENIVTGASTLDDLRAQDKISWVTPTEAGSFAVNAQGMPVGSQNPARAAVMGGTAPSTGGGSGSGIKAKNNPGALRVPGSNEFQSFATEAEGIAAQEALLGRYNKRGLNTVSKVVETYAPRASRGGDNTDEQVNNYISYVSGRLGVRPGDTIPPEKVPQLAAAMREFETGDRKPIKSAGDAPRKVASKAEYDKLPKGARYTAPDGSVRTKS